MDEGQLGWELVFHRNSLGVDGLGALARAICEAAADGLSGLGVAAKFRPRNDIEVEGRKICGTGGFFDGDTLFFQGTLLIDMDPGTMAAALNVPREKPASGGPDAATRRMVTLGELLGDGLPAPPAIQDALLAGFARRLGIEPRPGEITGEEEALAKRLHDDEIGTDAFVAEIDDPDSDDALVSATHTAPGGTLRAYVRLEGAARDRVREVLITGDFFVTPPRAVLDLEASLRGVGTAELGDAVERFFADYPIGLCTVAATDFRGRAGGRRVPRLCQAMMDPKNDFQTALDLFAEGKHRQASDLAASVAAEHGANDISSLVMGLCSAAERDSHGFMQTMNDRQTKFADGRDFCERVTHALLDMAHHDSIAFLEETFPRGSRPLFHFSLLRGLFADGAGRHGGRVFLFLSIPNGGAATGSRGRLHPQPHHEPPDATGGAPGRRARGSGAAPVRRLSAGGVLPGSNLSWRTDTRAQGCHLHRVQ